MTVESKPVQQALRRHLDLRRAAGLPETPPLDGIFPDTGLAFFRTGWDDQAEWLAFDAATGYGGGHFHLSRLAIEFHALGRTLIVDPGIFDYEMSHWQGPAGKKTAIHATCNVDMLNQCNVAAQFLQAASDEHWACAHGRYAGGYWTGQYTWGFNQGHGAGVYGFHDRVLLWFKRRFLLVLDTLRTDAGCACHVNWPLDAGPWSVSDDRFRVWTRGGAANVLVRLLPIASEPGMASLAMYEGDDKAQLGFIARDKAVIPAPLISWRFDSQEIETATVIVPFSDKIPEFEWASGPGAGTDKRSLILRWPDGTTDTVLWKFRLGTCLGRFRLGTEEIFSTALLLARSDSPARPSFRFELPQSTYVRQFNCRT